MGGGSSKESAPSFRAGAKGIHRCATDGCFQHKKKLLRKDDWGQLEQRVVLGWHMSEEHKKALDEGLDSEYWHWIKFVILEYLSEMRSANCILRKGLFSEDGFHFPHLFFEGAGGSRLRMNVMSPSLSVCPLWVSHGISDRTIKKEKSLFIVVVGNGAVGKTCLVRCLCYGAWDLDGLCDPTIQDDDTIDLRMPNDQEIRLEILDTAGNDDFIGLRKQWYRSADVLMICADHSASKTLEEQFQPHLKIYQRMLEEGAIQAPVILVGCKCDLPLKSERRASQVSRVLPLSDEFDVPYVETSAKFNLNVELAFQTAVYEHWLTQMYFSRK